MIVNTIPVTAFSQNCRILLDEQTGASLVIDPGGDVQSIFALIEILVTELSSLKCPNIFLTHAHLDHCGGVVRLTELLQEKFSLKPKLYAHRLESQMRANVARQAMMFGASPEEFQNVPEPDEYLEDEQIFTFGQYKGRILFTPGHSPGHVSLFFPTLEVKDQTFVISSKGLKLFQQKIYTSPLLIAGDTLFQGSIGRTDLPGGDFATLAQSIKEKLYTLPDETIVKSGHGEDTIIEDEKRYNPFVKG
ncbi:MAG: MBL fold metallo-hydrolase [Proteobacteria bacterium]|nr:MBL fold metallo-hydrolase [Pseudomonadota bacterium]